MNDTSGVFEGYASLFNRADASGDIIAPGAFASSLRSRERGAVRMLFQHDPSEPVGVWLELREDRHGLFARGRLSLGVQRADEIYTLIRDGALNGLSIGFRTVQARRIKAPGIRRITRADLWEISLVTFPMLAGARVTALAHSRSIKNNRERGT